MVGVFVARGDSVRVAITGAGEDGVFRHEGLEAALASSFAPHAVDSVAVSGDEMISDMHAASDHPRPSRQRDDKAGSGGMASQFHHPISPFFD